MSAQTTSASETFTETSARALFSRNFALFNEHDMAHVPTLVGEDVVFQDDAWPETIHGRAEMERFFAALWRAMPDLRFELVDGPFVAGSGRRAAVRVRFIGTALGPIDPPGFAPTGRPVTGEFAGFYEFDETDRIRRARVILDMNAVGRQVGALPPQGSRGERLAVAFQRLVARRMRSARGRA